MMILSIVHMWFLPIPEKEIVHIEHQDKVDLRGTYALVKAIPGLLALIVFSTINNFLGGTFMGLMDAYGLSLVSVEVWGLLFAVISCGFIIGGLVIAKYGLGKTRFLPCLWPTSPFGSSPPCLRSSLPSSCFQWAC